MAIRANLAGQTLHGLLIDVHKEVDHVVLRLSGRLSLQSAPRVREVAVKSLVDTGRVLIDVSNLRAPQPSFVTVFPTALAVAGGWPWARLILFGADVAMRSMLVSTRITETVHLATDLSSARALLHQRPAEVRRHRDLPAHPAAPATARLLVREACVIWSIPQAVREIAELVANELVSNAVEHAHSACRVTVVCTESAFQVSVRDYRLMPIPQPRPIDIDAFRGRGLHLVAALAQSWGIDPHPDGKAIWANLPLDSPG